MRRPADDDDPLEPEPPSEAAVVALIARVLDAAGIPADLRDDCAHLPGPGTALVTTDSLVEDRHFQLDRDTPYQVGVQAAVANLSDLAASGGGAGWLVWALCLPHHWSLPMIGELTRGFAETAARHGFAIIGGNLSRTDGPAVIAVTAGGPLAGARAFDRSGARPGDSVYVTGPLGDAALGYLDADAAARAARHRWRPHLPEARALAEWGRVSAAMDISDGLLIDADRIARASGVALDIDPSRIPVSAHYRARRGADLRAALTGGEDYVLLFTAPADDPPPLAAAAHLIGRVLAGRGLRLNGAPVAAAGHDHFAPAPAAESTR